MINLEAALLVTTIFLSKITKTLIFLSLCQQTKCMLIFKQIQLLISSFRVSDVFRWTSKVRRMRVISCAAAPCCWWVGKLWGLIVKIIYSATSQQSVIRIKVKKLWHKPAKFFITLSTFRIVRGEERFKLWCVCDG